MGPAVVIGRNENRIIEQRMGSNAHDFLSILQCEKNLLLKLTGVRMKQSASARA